MARGAPENVELVEQSFPVIARQGRKLTAAFYRELFAGHPEIEAMFAGVDMTAQHDKLFATLALLVANLRRPEMIAAELRSLGQRHAGYAVRPEQYPHAKTALLAALAELLGEAWDEPQRQAWCEAYDLVVELMLEGASAPPSR
jgi:hemoglobin-like flavoprotein